MGLLDTPLVYLSTTSVTGIIDHLEKTLTDPDYPHSFLHFSISHFTPNFA